MRRRAPLGIPRISTAGFEGSACETFASAPTTSCSTRPVWSIEAGASSAARIVGAMSTSIGGCSNAFTFGPAATITPSIRWSPTR